MSQLSIILASTSPRRLDLLKQIRLPVRVVAPNADETPRRGETPEKLVRRLCLAKAVSVHETMTLSVVLGQSLVIIAADTIVVDPKSKKVLGKPAHSAEARRMLKSLSHRTHSVLTGFCMISVNPNRPVKPWIRVVKTQVKMRKLSQKMIDDYIATGEPMDKAGAYGAQGIGGALIEKISGSFTNVVGLPITEILADLETQFKVKPFSWL
jgi:septum formation protein